MVAAAVSPLWSSQTELPTRSPRMTTKYTTLSGLVRRGLRGMIRHLSLGSKSLAAIEERAFLAYNPLIPGPPAAVTPTLSHMTDDSASPSGAITQWLLDWGRSDKKGLDQMLPV